MDKNKDATKEIQHVAEELAVVHTVLKQDLDDAKDDVAQAVIRTGEAQDKLESAAEKLEHVNQALEDQIKGQGGKA